MPTRDGYTFLGWYEDKEYQFDKITAENLFGSKKNKTVYAIWGDNKRRVKVHFDPVDGECDTEYKYAYYDRIYGDLPVPTKYGYTFSGWTNEKGDTVSCNTYMRYSSGEVTLYANYKICNISLLFDSNYSGGRYYRKSVEYMSKIGELPYLNVTRIGYSFDGWYTEREGGRKVEPTDVVDFAEYTTYYAHWIKLEDCKITIHKNDGSGKIYTDLIANGDTFDISEVQIPDNDKIFIGWYDQEKGGEKIQGKLKITQDIDIYAHWKTDGYCVITAHIGDRSRRVEISEVKYGEPLGDLYYNVNGATFLGWYTEVYYGEKLDENTIITQDIDIYAHWSKYYGSVIVKESYKTSYQLNETVSPYDFKLQYKIGSNYDIDEEGMTRVRCTADTSDYGIKAVYFTFIHDYEEGVFTYTGEGTIFVEGCPHDSTTHIEDACVPSCKTPTGYTGDTICDRCGKKIRMGEELPSLGHDENTKTITYDIKPGCIAYGYKGRVECAECGEILDWGEAIEPLGHDENTPVKIIRKVDATCTKDGYTGDATCLKCGQTVKLGEIIPATGHDYTRNIEKAKFNSAGLIKDVCNRCYSVIRVEEIPSARLNISTRQLSYNATVQTPEISVINVPDDCYTLEVEKGSEIGYYKVTATLSGDYYEGKKTDYYRILPPSTDIETLTALSKGITVKPSSICDAVDGYQIEYRVNQIMSVVTTVNFANNGRTEFVKTGLESKTSYMVRIRAYKDVVEDGKNARYYSDWSDYKDITTLK
ncbi:MAG: InlB B-repeat-containing protein [Eubacterium sp.]|nr:InlB B-repeat-containing protein [Eubacterium sp.]